MEKAVDGVALRDTWLSPPRWLRDKDTDMTDLASQLSGVADDERSGRSHSVGPAA